MACRGCAVGGVEEARAYLAEKLLLLHLIVWLCWRGGVARGNFAALVWVEEECDVVYLLRGEDSGVVDGACIWCFCICIQMVRPDVLQVAEVEVW